MKYKKEKKNKIHWTKRLFSSSFIYGKVNDSKYLEFEDKVNMRIKEEKKDVDHFMVRLRNSLLQIKPSHVFYLV